MTTHRAPPATTRVSVDDLGEMNDDDLEAVVGGGLPTGALPYSSTLPGQLSDVPPLPAGSTLPDAGF